jgi:hypothetical protein
MKRFLTRYRRADRQFYAAEVDALDWEHAQMLCDQRGFGEIVDGMLMCVFDGSLKKEQVDAICESYDSSDEPPDASEFGRPALLPDHGSCGTTSS